MKNKISKINKLISKINKLTTRSKILIGATTTIAIGSAVVLPVVMSSKKETKSKKTKISEALKNLTEEELEKNDEKHLKNQNRKKWYPGNPEMNKWIKDAIHKIKGLESLPNNDIVINNNKNGEINIKIENHGTITPVVLKNFVSINTLKDLVKAEYAKAPQTKDTNGNKDLFDAIKKAYTQALANIQAAKTSQEINQAKDEGVTAIKNAFIAYNQDLATTKLTKDKNAKKILIDKINPQSTLTTGATNPTAATALDQAKTAAKDAIQNASSANLNSIFNTQKGKVDTARDAYDTAIKAANLAFAKNQAKSLVNTEYAKAPKTKDPDGDQDLFDAIKEAKENALTDIQNTNNHQEINQAKTKGVTAIQDSITAYNQDLATTKLTKDKNAKKILIDNITPQSTLTTGAANPTAATALAQAKTAAKDAIENASSADLSSIFNTQKAKVEKARDAAEQAIQAANNLTFAKTKAANLVNTAYDNAPQTKDTDGDQTLFGAIKKAKDKALANIQNANTSEKIDQAKEDGLLAIQEAISIYNKYLEFKNQSDISQAKIIANEIIDSINPGIDSLPGVEVTSAMQSALNKSKEDAKTEIKGKLDKAAITDSLNKNLPLVKEARDNLKQDIRKANVVQNVVTKLPKLIKFSINRDEFRARSKISNQKQALREIIEPKVIDLIKDSDEYKNLKQNQKDIICTWLSKQKIVPQKDDQYGTELQFSDEVNTYEFEIDTSNH